MNVKKVMLPIIAFVAVIGIIAFLLFWYSNNQTLVEYSTEIEVPSRLIQWVEKNTENFSDEQWLLSNGYQKAYDTIKEVELYVCSYTYSPTLEEFLAHVDSSQMSGYVFEHESFQKGLSVTSQGKCIRYFPIDTYWLFHMEEYRQTETWSYRYIFTQETGASIEIEMQIPNLPQEEHETIILEFVEQLLG